MRRVGGTTKEPPRRSDETDAAAPPAILVFSAPLALNLSSSPRCRLPPTYVGVRRVRPSSRTVGKAFLSDNTGKNGASALKEDAATPRTDAAVYKMVDPETGQERRMTNQEKKLYKLQQRRERKEQRDAQRLEQQQQQGQASQSTTSTTSQNDESTTPSESVEVAAPSPSSSADRYLPLQVDQSALEQELADLRGEREGVPPVLLAPALASCALQTGVFRVAPGDVNVSRQDGSLDSSANARLDDELCSAWAATLRQHLLAAEEVRSQEDLRPMPYQLVPEPWSRMKPTALGQADSNIICSGTTVEAGSAVEDEPSRLSVGSDWSFCQIRPNRTPMDADMAAVVQLLHTGTQLHVACGAKFGCDLLIYDGPRVERHAFAGVRVLVSNADDKMGAAVLPLPSAYDMAGYVRCMNTAGKLALLATVVRSGDSIKVAIVDLALEKVRNASAHGRSRKKAPKEHTLSKKNKRDR